MGIVREMWVEDWLGKDNKVGCDIWRKKYQRNGVNFHGPYEFVSVQVMEKAMQVVTKICEITAQFND